MLNKCGDVPYLLYFGLVSRSITLDFALTFPSESYVRHAVVTTLLWNEACIA